MHGSAFEVVLPLFAAEQYVLAECRIHGSFVVRASQVNKPCERCILRAPRQRPISVDTMLRSSRPFEGCVALTQDGRTYYVENTAALRLHLAHNSLVLFDWLDMAQSIEDTLRWCDS